MLPHPAAVERGFRPPVTTRWGVGSGSQVSGPSSSPSVERQKAISSRVSTGLRPRAVSTAIIPIYVVGDAVWDLLAARRAGMLRVGLLSGGYGEDELLAAGAFRVYRGAA